MKPKSTCIYTAHAQLNNDYESKYLFIKSNAMQKSYKQQQCKNCKNAFNLHSIISWYVRFSRNARFLTNHLINYKSPISIDQFVNETVMSILQFVSILQCAMYETAREIWAANRFHVSPTYRGRSAVYT